MKPLFASAFALGLAVALPACAGGNQDTTAVATPPQPSAASTGAPAETARPTPVAAASGNQQPTGGTTMNPSTSVRLKLTFNGDEVIVRMHDNPTSRDFMATLPRTLTFEDYAATEKISRLDRRLSTEGAPEGHDPSVGDFAYYAPWGNLIIYYKDFTYSTGVVPLGTIESGVEKFARLTGNFSVKVERME